MLNKKMVTLSNVSQFTFFFFFNSVDFINRRDLLKVLTGYTDESRFQSTQPNFRMKVLIVFLNPSLS